MRRIDWRIGVVVAVFAGSALAQDAAEKVWVWRDGRPTAKIVPPELEDRYKALVDVTINGYLADAYRWSLSSTLKTDAPGTYIVVGNEANNIVIRDLVKRGVDLKRKDLGDEGFRIFTHEDDGRRFVIVTANTGIGLKHGCQELVYFRMPATTAGAWVEWPMDVVRKPAWDYRGIYILPCWAAHDSESHWKRVMDFCSELTLNRVWFWLNGFPLLEQYGGEYEGTDLANAYNVNGLVGFCRSRGMKFYIGGGWFTWHHGKIADGSVQRGIQYYRDMLALLPEAEGIYLEPAGEGRDVEDRVWRERTEALGMLANLIWRERPEFEFAIATGEFNTEPYFKMLDAIDDERIYWWWCWGDPIRDKALERHPLVLRWHTNIQMSNYHGSTRPPQPEEAALTGFATSYDPGQGYGNPWNGWPAMGIDFVREFEPRNMPYFSHEYRFRERCWDPDMDDKTFARRLSRRLFDADVEPSAIDAYLELASYCPAPVDAPEKAVQRIEAFVRSHLGRGTRRTQDTFARMQTALKGIREHQAKAKEAK